jgi:hypothetical protein
MFCLERKNRGIVLIAINGAIFIKNDGSQGKHRYLIQGIPACAGNQIRRLKQEPVHLDIQVEDLAEKYPQAVGFLTRRGVRCIRCGEPVWGTLGQLLKEDGVENPRRLVEELNTYLNSLSP